MEKSRLLDIRFAKLLGCSIHEPKEEEIANIFCEPRCPCQDGQHEDYENGLLYYYTRDLSAAWSGSENLRPFLCCRTLFGDYGYNFRAEVIKEDFENDNGPNHGPVYRGRSSDYPAEALVRACLLAYGYKKEDLYEK